MRKADLELHCKDHPLYLVNCINAVLYEQGFGIQFVLDEEKSQDETLAYNLSRSVELIQE